jgi:hypothetical protein
MGQRERPLELSSHRASHVNQLQRNSKGGFWSVMSLGRGATIFVVSEGIGAFRARLARQSGLSPGGNIQVGRLDD